MANNKKYKGSLNLDWINKDLSLYYEIDEKEGRGIKPIWVSHSDIKVAEPRILKYEKVFGDPKTNNFLVKGDNLLILRSLVEMFKDSTEKNRIKCIYIDPPYNTGNAFKHYDDNLAHSEWLTMMRDRLKMLRQLLRKDGCIVVQIDNQEFAYLKVLMDEVFGRSNYVDFVTLETRTPSGYKVINPGFFNASEYLLIYAYDKKRFKHNTIYKEKEFEEHYNKFIKNKTKNPKKWEVLNLKDVITKKLKINTWKEGEKTLGKEALLDELRNFAIEHADQVAALEFVGRKASRKVIDAKEKSLKNRNKVSVLKGNGNKDTYLYNGREIVFYSKKVRELDGDIVGSTVMTNIWTDISWSGIGTEGDVEFKYSKKPEKLIKRIIEFSTEKGDYVLDSFAGLGTTGAVAQKCNRRWIMIELGDHAETKIIPRLQKVTTGKDQKGISRDVNWKGGGGFKYYKLGDSVIHEEEMNWKMKNEEMAEAVFLHFQYKLEKCSYLQKNNMFLGKHRALRYHFAICFASQELISIAEEQYEGIIDYLDKEKSFRHLTIFTNTPVAVSPEVIDERVLIEKIPAKILREYNLL